MLKHLYIKNYALIKELDIDLHTGFSVITGETGAGKSIILGAIGLLLGQKADSKSIMPGTDKCTIEATFDITGYRLESIFQQYDADYDSQECIIRRELAQSGKSRAFVNDSPTSVAFLKELGYHLIDIHSQHQNLLISREDYQLSILDLMAQDSALLAEYQEAYQSFRQTEKKLAKLMEETKKAKADEDYLTYQLEQLEELNPKANEDEQLEREQNELTHAEDIKTSLYEIDNFFSNESECGGVLDMSRRICNTLESLTHIYPSVEGLGQRMDSALIEMKDISAEISDLAENIEYNTERLEQVNSRLDRIYTLEQKHGVNSTAELATIMKEIKSRLNNIASGDEQIQQLRQQFNLQQETARKISSRLSAERTKAAKLTEKQVKEMLSMLDMPNNHFQISIEATEGLTPMGTDKVLFLFSANKNAPLRQISEIASGGEIARVMLSLKAMTSRKVNLPTIIFDEIDTGVSGKVADSMSLLMKEMGRGEGHQVIAITHLPQIAAQGDKHYWVYKQDDAQQTFSHIRELTPEDRITEIAHMLSGSQITAAAIENAKQLLNC